MTKEFTLPELGEGIKDGDVVKVLAAPGAAIKADQTVLEIETNKAVIEVPAPQAGVIKEVYVKAGDKAKVGQVIYTYDVAGDTAPVKTQTKPVVASENTVVAAAAPPAEPVILSAPTPPPAAPASPPAILSEPLTSTASTSPATSPATSGIAAPAARREAREIGVDISLVHGSGPGGRVSVSDVRNHARTGKPSGPAESGASQNMARATTNHTYRALPDFSKYGEVERKSMANVRRITAERLSEAWQTIPHVTQFDKADVTVLEKLRSKFAKRAEEAGGKLTVTVILMKILASALKVFPQFNASIDMTTHEIVYKKFFNIGIAVDTDRGLIVPVIKNVDKMNIVELSRELTIAAEKARQRKTTVDEMQGASITITNLGGIGGMFFTPIINPPEVAILGVSRTQIEPVLTKDGSLENRQMLPLSLSYDHRLIDGADGARFLRWIAEAIKDPFLMELEG